MIYGPQVIVNGNLQIDQSTSPQVMAWCRQATSHYRTWANVDPGLCHYTASPGHNELRFMTSQIDKSTWLDAARQQATTWANVDPDLCRHTASPGHNELRFTQHHLSYHKSAVKGWLTHCGLVRYMTTLMLTSWVVKCCSIYFRTIPHTVSAQATVLYNELKNYI